MALVQLPLLSLNLGFLGPTSVSNPAARPLTHSYPAPLRLGVQRLRTLQEKKNAQAKVSRRDIALLLEKGRIETARIKTENSECLSTRNNCRISNGPTNMPQSSMKTFMLSYSSCWSSTVSFSSHDSASWTKSESTSHISANPITHISLPQSPPQHTRAGSRGQRGRVRNHLRCTQDGTEG